MRNIFYPVLFVVYLISATASAQDLDLDIIDLKHRTADEVIPIIKPFLIPEATVTSRGYKLIVKSTTANLKQIREIIEEVDAALKQLQITVSIGHHSEQVENKTQAELMAQVQDDDSQVQVQAGDVPGSGSTGAIVRGEVKTDKTEVKAKVKTKRVTTSRHKPVNQTIRSVEGRWATIQTGQSIPIIERTRNPDGTVTQTVRYRGATSGFKVLPRIQPNNKVALYIRPFQTTVSPQGGGRFDIQNMETNVVGDLGEWIPLGSLNELSVGKVNTNVTSTRSRTERRDSVFVKIDIVQ